MNLLCEFKEKGMPTGETTPIMNINVFEDNSGASEIANNHKYCPRTKHLNVKLHHFWDYGIRNEILIKAIETPRLPDKSCQ